MRLLSACGLKPRMVFGNTGQNNGRAVGEFSDKRQAPAHGRDGLPERGEQQVAALFEPRNTVLGDPESFSQPDLRELARVPQLAQGHLLRDQLSGAGLDLLALGGAQFPDDVDRKSTRLNSSHLVI